MSPGSGQKILRVVVNYNNEPSGNWRDEGTDSISSQDHEESGGIEEEESE